MGCQYSERNPPEIRVREKKRDGGSDKDEANEDGSLRDFTRPRLPWQPFEHRSPTPSPKNLCDSREIDASAKEKESSLRGEIATIRIILNNSAVARRIMTDVDSKRATGETSPYRSLFSAEKRSIG